MGTTILSRFDLIFIIRDVRNKDRDRNLATHIMNIHIHAENRQQEVRAPVELDMLTKYVAYARNRVKPRLTESAAETLRNAYVKFRKAAKQKELDTGEIVFLNRRK